MHQGKIITPLRITEKDVPLDNYTNLLLIEGKETCHYTWIKNFNALMCFDSTRVHRFCPFCCSPFDIRYQKKLEDHMPHCRKNGGQRTMLPKKGGNIVQFRDFHKALKRPVVIYADFEAINENIEQNQHDIEQPTDGVEANTEHSDNESRTKKITKHVCSGFTYTVTSPYFPTRTCTYRGQDAGERFLHDIIKEEKEIFDWLYANEKPLDMSDVDEEAFNNASLVIFVKKSS